MDTARFDHLTRTVSLLLSRRSLAVGLGLSGNVLHSLVHPKKKRRKNKKRKKEKIKRNSFGCVNVGHFCKNAGQCCSGICQGKKPKKGKKDMSKCVAHNVGGCPAGADSCGGTAPTHCGTGGTSGSCFQTTGKADFCGANGDCFVCAKDTDCEPDFGPGAACIVCAQCPATGNTGCVEAAS